MGSQTDRQDGSQAGGEGAAHALSPAPGREELGPEDLAELLGAFNDVTGKLQRSHDRLQEEVARLRRELGEANDALERSRRLAALGEMAAGIAHEIRNPLGSIALYARMLEEDLEDRPEQRETASKARRAVRGLERIVRDVLAFAREIRVDRHPTDPSDVIDQVAEGVLAAEGAQRVELARRDRAGAVTAQVDPALLAQALTNVLRNAVEAVEEHGGGEVAIEAERAGGDGSEGAGASGAGTLLRVIDDGPGVAPDVVERMFNPFFTTRKAGTGLGLAIVHRIVDAHGGVVRVRNRGEGTGSDGRASRGAVVELLLPDAPPEGRADQQDASREQTEGRVRVRARAGRTEQAA